MRGRGARTPESCAASRRPLVTAALLLLATLVSYRLHGFLPKGLARRCCYQSIHRADLRTLQAARRIPREGLLLCVDQFAGFCANREKVIDWHHYDPGRHQPDLVFTELKHLDNQRLGFRDWLESGTFGLIFFDGENIILTGGDTPGATYNQATSTRGVATGHQVLEDDSTFTYLMEQHWTPEGRGRASTVDLFDPALGIEWPIGREHAIVAHRDTLNPPLAHAEPMRPRRTLVAGTETRLGRAMLVEFDYRNNLRPSFPGVIAPLEELWVSWVMKTMALKPTYISMLRGRA